MGLAGMRLHQNDVVYDILATERATNNRVALLLSGATRPSPTPSDGAETLTREDGKLRRVRILPGPIVSIVGEDGARQWWVKAEVLKRGPRRLGAPSAR